MIKVAALQFLWKNWVEFGFSNKLWERVDNVNEVVNRSSIAQYSQEKCSGKKSKKIIQIRVCVWKNISHCEKIHMTRVSNVSTSKQLYLKRPFLRPIVQKQSQMGSPQRFLIWTSTIPILLAKVRMKVSGHLLMLNRVQQNEIWLLRHSVSRSVFRFWEGWNFDIQLWINVFTVWCVPP